jgi:hypothetical protein
MCETAEALCDSHQLIRDYCYGVKIFTLYGDPAVERGYELSVAETLMSRLMKDAELPGSMSERLVADMKSAATAKAATRAIAARAAALQIAAPNRGHFRRRDRGGASRGRVFDHRPAHHPSPHQPPLGRGSSFGYRGARGGFRGGNAPPPIPGQWASSHSSQQLGSAPRWGPPS